MFALLGMCIPSMSTPLLVLVAACATCLLLLRCAAPLQLYLEIKYLVPLHRCCGLEVVAFAAQNCEYSPLPVVVVELLDQGRGFSRRAKWGKIEMVQSREMEKWGWGIYKKGYGEEGKCEWRW